MSNFKHRMNILRQPNLVIISTNSYKCNKWIILYWHHVGNFEYTFLSLQF